MHSSDVEKLRYKNYDQTETQFHVSYLRDVLKPLKGRCYINIDKFWTCMQEITDLVTELGIEDQVIIKKTQMKRPLPTLNASRLTLLICR